MWRGVVVADGGARRLALLDQTKPGTCCPHKVVEKGVVRPVGARHLGGMVGARCCCWRHEQVADTGVTHMFHTPAAVWPDGGVWLARAVTVATCNTEDDVLTVPDIDPNRNTANRFVAANWK